jgi:hypothetical protein
MSSTIDVSTRVRARKARRIAGALTIAQRIIDELRGEA